MRLLGFERVELQLGESQQVTVTADPRLLACYDAEAGEWHITEGIYRIALGKAADNTVCTAAIQLGDRRFGS